MTIVRCYVPLSADQLRRLGDERHLDGPFWATTVTRSVRAGIPNGDLEEWEFAALQAAALGLVADGQAVIVAAVDVEDDQVDATRPEGPQVRVLALDLPRVAALHVGDDVVTGDRAALPAPDAEQEIELSWYDTTELAHVVELSDALGAAPAGREPAVGDPAAPPSPDLT